MTRVFLCVGPFDRGDPDLAAAAGAAGGELRHAPDAAALRAAAAERPDVVLLHLGAPDLDGLADALHATAALTGVPLLAVAPELTLEGALRAAAVGADDFLDHADVGDHLAAYLAVASEAPHTGTPTPVRSVLLVDGWAPRARLLTFLLSQAGFDVTRAADADAARSQLAEEDCDFDLVILDFGIPGCEPPSILAEVAERHETAPPGIGIVTNPSSEAAAAALAGGFRHLWDGRRPPDELVFLANEATVQDHGHLRASPRFPCAVMVRFREERGHWRHGLTHNVSISGLYVRTIMPPAPGALLDIELTPPGVQPIATKARVAWRKAFSARADRTVPTGMGLKLCEPELGVQKAMAVFALRLASDMSGMG